MSLSLEPSSRKNLTQEQLQALPPLVVGYQFIPWIVVGQEREEFYCGIHWHKVDWPCNMEPIWRGEVPAGACCHECGIELEELQ